MIDRSKDLYVCLREKLLFDICILQKYINKQKQQHFYPLNTDVMINSFDLFPTEKIFWRKIF